MYAKPYPRYSLAWGMDLPVTLEAPFPESSADRDKFHWNFLPSLNIIKFGNMCYTVQTPDNI